MKHGRATITGIRINELPKLTREDRRRLLERIQNRDLEARDTFFKGNLRLVWSVVQKFAGSDAEIDDLFQIGCIGLVQAVNRFDPSFNVEFSTYAVPMIRGQIQRFLRESNHVHVPRSKMQRFADTCAKRADMERELGRDISYGEAAAALGYPEAESTTLYFAFMDPCRFNEPVQFKNTSVADGQEITLMDMLPDPKTDENHTVENLDLSLALEKLSPMERKIINLRYFEGLTQRQIAKLLDYSQAQISRLERAALIKLRKAL